MEPYNGYSGKERDVKYQEYKRLRDLGQSVPAVPPCRLCGDPNAVVEPHSEDYSKPYEWLPPAEYMICHRCHMWIHKRFDKPNDWEDFKSHVRRGGYAVEFTTPGTGAERRKSALAREQGTVYKWLPIEGRHVPDGQEWWDKLTMDKSSLTAAWARPRP